MAPSQCRLAEMAGEIRQTFFCQINKKYETKMKNEFKLDPSQTKTSAKKDHMMRTSQQDKVKLRKVR
jgi:hypothetical protein